MKRDDVAGAPGSENRRVAAPDRRLRGCAVDCDRRAPRPAGNAELHAEGRRRVRLNGDPDVARPRIVAGFPDMDRPSGDPRARLEAAVEVERDAVVARRDGIARDGGDETRDVHRAARADVPGPASMLAAALERVGVEIVRPLAREAA